MKYFLLFLLFYPTSLVVSQDKLPSLTIRTTDGKIINTENLATEGEITVISFWATWCKPCLEELEAISDAIDSWKEKLDFKFIAISVDDSRSSSRVKSFVAGKGWPFEFYLDPNQELKRAMNITEIPFMIILDRNKRIVYRHVSYIQGFEQNLFDEIVKISKQQ